MTKGLVIWSGCGGGLLLETGLRGSLKRRKAWLFGLVVVVDFSWKLV